MSDDRPDRRSVLRGALAATAAVAAPSVPSPARSFPKRRKKAMTPSQVEGPFYPGKKTRKAGNDLVVVPGAEPAEGVRVLLLGAVLQVGGAPVTDGWVEIWQTCHRGRYDDRWDDFGSEIPRDPGFAYRGACRLSADGTYAFRTVIPRRYPSGSSKEWWRPPHVHFKVFVAGKERLTTQMYFDDPLDLDNDWRHGAVQAVDRIIADVPMDRRWELVARLGPVDDAAWADAAVHGIEASADDGGDAYGPIRAGRFDLLVNPPEEDSE